jgi:hypothetical protein
MKNEVVESPTLDVIWPEKGFISERHLSPYVVALS